MAHIAKSTKSAIGGLTRHYERYKKENGEYIKFGNQEIDISKTYLNYNLATHQNLSQLDFIKKRTSEVYCFDRKDVNLMCTWVVTKPSFITDQEQQDFFKKTYNFLEKRYGKENVISSYVHLDETTPHLHFAFIPITFDKKKEYYKVSAKEVVNRIDLKTFHNDLNRVMTEYFKRDIGILNGATEQGNKSVVELKKEKYNDLVKKFDERIEAIEFKNNIFNEIDISYDDKKPNILKKIILTDIEYNKLINKAKLGELVEYYSEENKKTVKLQEKLKETVLKYNELVTEYKDLRKKTFNLQDKNELLTKKINKLENASDETLEHINKVIENLDENTAKKFINNWNQVKNNTIIKDFKM